MAPATRNNKAVTKLGKPTDLRRTDNVRLPIFLREEKRLVEALSDWSDAIWLECTETLGFGVE